MATSAKARIRSVRIASMCVWTSGFWSDQHLSAADLDHAIVRVA
jgi:hypothetical protein